MPLAEFAMSCVILTSQRIIASGHAKAQASRTDARIQYNQSVAGLAPHLHHTVM